MDFKLLLTLLLAVNPSYSALKTEKQTILLFSFDGFRHDYIERENLKNFKELGQSGVWADSLEPTFVTKTFPNHFTIVTGLYEEAHGIVSNYMYDPLYHEHFDPIKSSSDPKWWNASVPIWISNEVQFLDNGKRTRKSATIQWPGSETSYQGRWPYDTMKVYESNFTTKLKFAKILYLLTQPNPVNFIATYFDEPDKTSHMFGPDHKNTSSVLKELDRMLGEFIQTMKKLKLFDKVNILLVSDHGMSNVPRKNIINLTDYTNPKDYDLVNYGTFVLIRPKLNKTEEVYEKLRKIPHVKTYYRKDIPEEWHYKHNRRVTKIFSIADEGYYIAPGNQNITVPRGDHGYDNKLKNMHGIFIAHGPSFKKIYKVNTVKNIDLYALMCNILEIEPNPNHGSFDRVKNMIREKTIFTVIMKSPALIITLLSVCGIFVLVVVLGCTLSCYRNLTESSRYRRVDEQDVPLTEWEVRDGRNDFDMLERDPR